MKRLIASFFGSGLLLGRIRGSDAGSGTVGSLVALALSVWIGSTLGWQGQLAMTAIAIVASIWSTWSLASEVGDAGWIVIDEAAGTFVATLGLLGWPALAGFVVFRVADIAKGRLTGVAQAEGLPGAWGITADDLVAGLYGLAAGHILRLAIQ